MIHWVDERLTRWGLWLVNNRGMGSKGLSAALDGMPAAPSPSALIPVASIECSRMHDWVSSLPAADRTLLVEVYCSTRNSDDSARHLKMSKATLYRHLDRLQRVYVLRENDRRQRAAMARKTILESKLKSVKLGTLCDRSVGGD